MRLIQIPLGGKEMVNAFVVCGERAVVVDTGNPSSSDRILQSLHSNGIDEESVGLILITHAHRDHYGSAAELKRALDAPVAVQRADADYVANGEIAPIVPSGIKGVLALPFTSRGKVPPVQPDIVFDEELDLRDFQVEGKALSTPGHTDGSCSVIVGRECIAGDLLMFGSPFRNVPAHPLFAVDKERCRSSLSRIMETGVERVYASHGGPWPATQVRKRVLRP